MTGYSAHVPDTLTEFGCGKNAAVLLSLKNGAIP